MSSAGARERGGDIRLEHDVRARRLARELVRDGDDGCICDVGVAEKTPLELGWGDL